MGRPHRPELAQILSRRRPYEYYRELFRGRELPFAFVDLDRLAENRAAIAGRAGGKWVRLASKSIRSVAVLERILSSGPPFRGVMCFSAREAVFLSERGLDDLLVGYPVVQEAQIASVCQEIRRGRTITLVVDAPEHVTRIVAAARRHDVVVPLCLDVDLSLDLPGLRFGVFRSPIATVAAAVRLRDEIRAESSVRLDGILGYEAQVAGVPDKMGIRSGVVRLLKRGSRTLAARRRAAIVEAVGPVRFVNGGGTGSLESTREEDVVTEVAVGSGFYSPGLFDGYDRFRHQPSAAFATEIVRRPAPGIFTCHGGGYVASGGASKDKLPRPFLPEGARLLATEGAGEVQTPVLYRGPVPLAIGDPVFFRHAKAGELCEHFNTLLLVSKGRVVEEVTTYRGDGQSFL